MSPAHLGSVTLSHTPGVSPAHHKGCHTRHTHLGVPCVSGVRHRTPPLPAQARRRSLPEILHPRSTPPGPHVPPVTSAARVLSRGGSAPRSCALLVRAQPRYRPRRNRCIFARPYLQEAPRDASRAALPVKLPAPHPGGPANRGRTSARPHSQESPRDAIRSRTSAKPPLPGGLANPRCT